MVRPVIRAVVDTNVLISGLLSRHSPPAQIIDRWLSGEFVLITSAYQVGEIFHVLAYPRIVKRIETRQDEKQVLLDALKERAIWTEGLLRLPGVTRDVKDDPLIACAIEGNAKFVVSGDNDILELMEYADIRMIPPADFLKRLDGES